MTPRLPLALALFTALSVQAAPEPRSLIANGSFEAGVGPSSWGITDPNAGLLTQECLDPAGPAHGSVSLRLPVLPRDLFTAPTPVAKDGEYVFSVFLKAGAEVPVRLAYQAEGKREDLGVTRVKAGPRWQRFEARWPVARGTFNFRIAPETAREKESLWIDGVSLVLQGGAMAELHGTAAPAAFTPCHPVEAGLTSDVPGKVFYAGEPASVTVRVANYTKAATQADWVWRVTDLYGRTSAPKTLAVGVVPPDASKSVSLDLDTTRRGIFSLTGRLSNQKDDTTEICYIVIPRPAAGTLLAAHTSSNESTMPALGRAGIRWYESLTDHIHRLGNMRPKPDTFVWFDKEADCIPKYGMQGIGVLEYFMERGDFSWARGNIQKFDPPVVMRGSVLEAADHVRPDIWRDHVRQVMGHYRTQFRNWVIDDEVNSWPPEVYLDVLRETKAVAREIDPGIRVTTSACVDWFQELAAMGGLDAFDAVGGSIGNIGYWPALKTGWFARRHAKDVWVTGIFGRSDSFYHRHVPRSDWLHRATSMYRNTLRCFYLHRATSVSPYIFRLTVFSATNVMDKSGFDFDGSFKPHAFGFIAAGTVFQDCVLDPEPLVVRSLPLDDCYAFAFTRQGRSGVALCGAGAIRLNVPPDQVEILDWLANPLAENPVDSKNVVAGPGHLDITLGATPLYLYDKGVGHVRLRRAVEDAPTTPAVGSCEIFWPGPVGLTRATLQVNSTAQTQGDLPAGVAKVVRSVPQPNPDPKRPLENRKGAWMANCLRAGGPVAVDGRLDEWRGRSACWMYVCWGENSPATRRTLHIHSGGQFINHQPWYDIKAGFHTAYDDTALYFAFIVNDDQVAPPQMAALGRRDGVRVLLDTDVLGDLGTSFGSADDFTVEAVLDAPDKVRAVLRHGKEETPLSAAVGAHARGYAIEVTVPFRLLGMAAPKPMTAIGLDVIAMDADYDAAYTGPEEFRREFSELRWAADAPIGVLLFTGP